MAAITGKIGAVYYDSDALLSLTSHLQFSSAARTITISPAPTTGFIKAGFKVGQIINISATTGSTKCAGRKEIKTLTSQVMTVTTHVKMGTAGAGATAPTSAVAGTIAETTPGTLMAGFLNWKLNLGAEALDVTSFDSSGKKEYIAGLKNWDATVEKHWMSTGHNPTDWVGSSGTTGTTGGKKTVRLFLQYTSSPSTAKPSLYMEGRAVVTGMNLNAPANTVIAQSLTLQGDGTIPTITKWTTKWTT